MESRDATEEILAAGYESTADARRALHHLESRRTRLIDLRVSPSSVGNSDLGGGIRAQDAQRLNGQIDSANSLEQIEAQIRLLRRLLAD